MSVAFLSLAALLPTVCDVTSASEISGSGAFASRPCAFTRYTPATASASVSVPTPSASVRSFRRAERPSFVRRRRLSYFSTSQRIFRGDDGDDDRGDEAHRPNPLPFDPLGLRRISLPCRDAAEVALMEKFYVNGLGCSVVSSEEGEDVFAATNSFADRRTLAFGDVLIDLLVPAGLDSDSELEFGPCPNKSSTKSAAGEGSGATGVILSLRVSAPTSWDDDVRSDATSRMVAFGAKVAEERRGIAGDSRRFFTVVDPGGNVVELIVEDGVDVPADPLSSLAVTGAETECEDTLAVSADGGDSGGVDVAAANIESNRVRLGDREIESSAPLDGERVDVPPKPTPCVRICRYNSDFYGGQVCVGCFRDGYEIGTWSSMTPGEKSLALLDAADRCPSSGASSSPVEEKEQGSGGDEVLWFEGAVSREELIRQAESWKRIS